ncbi:MAG: FecR domain-containing protein [Verrucomicrobia bacterium]|nr:FecR domain-containing protein [Verrucomicrobiota bacterium]MDA1088146.1 FecR domain-containing protein [Verrucomicrobiota bacterium]
MNRIIRLGCAALITGALSTSLVSAKAFEPEFTITKIEGAVKVQSPGASRFSGAEAGASYKYGTVIQTKRRSTAVVQFSQGNTCRITARTTVAITASKANENLKVMKLNVGKLDLSMDEMVAGHKLQIETAAAVCGITGTKLTIEASRERNVNAVILEVKEVGSSVNLGNEIFEFNDVQGGEELVITVTDDKKYYRARIIKGDIEVELLGEDGGDSLNVVTGDLLKFFIRDYPDHSQVTLMVYGSDAPGAKPKFVRTFKIPLAEPPGAGGEDVPPGQTIIPPGPDKTELPPTQVTIPDTTPKGDR